MGVYAGGWDSSISHLKSVMATQLDYFSPPPQNNIRMWVNLTSLLGFKTGQVR